MGVCSDHTTPPADVSALPLRRFIFNRLHGMRETEVTEQCGDGRLHRVAKFGHLAGVMFSIRDTNLYVCNSFIAV